MENEKLIYAEPLETQFENLARSWRGTFSGPAYADALERLRNAPKVDAVPVVRCKHCQYSTSQENVRPGLIRCHNKNSPCYNRILSENDFCPYGEEGNAPMENTERKNCSHLFL